MKKTMCVLAGLLLVGASGATVAGGVVTATITKVGLIQSIGDELFVQISTAVNGPPACSNNASWQFVVSLSTAQGQQMLALLLTAKASQATIQFGGTGACSVYSNVETLDYIQF